jgi:hypothetical protein
VILEPKSKLKPLVLTTLNIISIPYVYSFMGISKNKFTSEIPWVWVKMKIWEEYERGAVNLQRKGGISFACYTLAITLLGTHGMVIIVILKDLENLEKIEEIEREGRWFFWEKRERCYNFFFLRRMSGIV